MQNESCSTGELSYLLRNYVIICYMTIQLWILTRQKKLLQVAPAILSKFVFLRLLCKISIFWYNLLVFKTYKSTKMQLIKTKIWTS